jgi:hypothetical protein
MKKIYIAINGFFIFSLLCVSFLSASGKAQAASATCYDVRGQGKQVVVSGIPNSGVVHFDPPDTPDVKYEACMEDPGNDNVGTFVYKGWAWNDNVGWISFYCADEDGDPSTPNTNLGVECGNYTYGVTMDGPDEASPGIFHGYAYGDATGYISFNCDGPGTCGTIPYSTRVETLGLCAGSVYGSPGPSPTCYDHGSDGNYVYGWSDSVGWINLDGMRVPWVDLIGVGVNASLNITPDPGDLNVAPYANNTNGYTLGLYLVNSKTGAAVDKTKYSFATSFDWANHIGRDQTDGLDGSDAVTLPTNFDMADYNAGTKNIERTLVSDAPSTALNKTGEDFNNQTFIQPKVPPVNEPQNYLKFNSLNISMIYDPGPLPAHKNNCVHGELYTCAAAPLYPVSGYEGKDFNFKPPVELTQFDDSANITYMSLRNLVAASITSVLTNVGCGSACANINARIQLGISGDSPFRLVVDTGQLDEKGNPEGFTAADPSTFDLPGVGSYPVMQFGLVCMNAGGCPAFGQDAYAYSVISYDLGGGTVKYFGNKLPRVRGSLVVNPVAKVVGSVYSTGVTNPQTGTVVKSLGDVSTNILRDTLFRNVSSIIAGKNRPFGGAATISGFGAGGFTVAGPVEKLMPDDAGVSGVYYFGTDLNVDTGDTLTDVSWTGERTLIVIGGNVYINSNLYNAAGGASKPRLGLIVLKDLATGKGGNIYVAQNVTDIQANIYADGSLFSYDRNQATPIITSTGVPYFASEGARFNALKNQLYIQGSIASQNTIGGAVATPSPILGDGSVASAAEGNYGNTPSGRSFARLYDLNFLRYFGYVFERDPATGDAVDQNGDGQLISKPVSEGGDLILIGGAYSKAFDSTTIQQNANSVLVTFDPPPASLPGFGVTTGAEVQVRPQ